MHTFYPYYPVSIDTQIDTYIHPELRNLNISLQGRSPVLKAELNI